MGRPVVDCQQARPLVGEPQMALLADDLQTTRAAVALMFLLDADFRAGRHAVVKLLMALQIQLPADVQAMMAVVVELQMELPAADS